MALFKSGNPALDKETFQDFAVVDDTSDVMILQGTVNKTAIPLVIVFSAALYPWQALSETHDVESMEKKTNTRKGFSPRLLGSKPGLVIGIHCPRAKARGN